MYIFFPQPMYICHRLWYGLLMTTKTTLKDDANDLLSTLKSLDAEDREKISAHVNLMIGAFTVVGLMFKSRRAAKAEDWSKATYYAVVVMAGQAGLRFRIEDMRRKGFIK